MKNKEVRTYKQAIILTDTNELSFTLVESKYDLKQGDLVTCQQGEGLILNISEIEIPETATLLEIPETFLECRLCDDNGAKYLRVDLKPAGE